MYYCSCMHFAARALANFFCAFLSQHPQRYRGSATRLVDDCDVTAYYRTQLSLSVTPITVYSIPGTNDYPRCSNPDEGWEHYQEYLMGIDTMYWNATSDYIVNRQVNRPENFAFLYKRALFVGLNMVGNTNDAERTQRLVDNIDWVIKNADEYGNSIDVIFVMGYGRLLAQENAPFYNAMKAKKETEWADKFFIYARRAAESGITLDVSGVQDFVELKVGNKWPIMDVRVRTDADGSARLQYRDAVDVAEAAGAEAAAAELAALEDDDKGGKGQGGGGPGGGGGGGGGGKGKDDEDV